ncbi:MAG: hypothetical protein JWO76_556 [Nocardioides sp.]|nr:hypothetical protein [Nocardioides sp.]
MSEEVVSTTEDAAPLLRVVNADATPEEIAAIVAVFAALGGEAATTPRRTPAWQAHHRKVRPTLPHGPGGWRASALPR